MLRVIVLSLVLLTGTPMVAADGLGPEVPGQQSPQAPFPLATALDSSGSRDVFPAPAGLCPHGSCPDKEQVVLARDPRLQGRLLASELARAETPSEGGWARGVELPPRPGRMIAASRDRLHRWLTELAPGLPPDTSPEDLRAEKRVEVYRPRLSVGPYWDALDWRHWPVTGAWSRTLEVAAGDQVEVRCSRLRPALGYLAPDPVAWLLREDLRGDPAGGIVEAWSDDSEGGSLPSISWIAEEACALRLLVAAYQPSSAGFLRLEVLVNRRPRWDEAGIFFGGVRIPQVEVAPEDVFHVVAGAPGGAPADMDAAIFLLADSPGAGGGWQAANNSLGLSPTLTVGIPETDDATVLLSAFGRAGLVRPRLLLSRHGPGQDRDGDGLDGALEAILGTCDGPGAEGCESPLIDLHGWDPVDTDMDGPTDLEELVGVRRCYKGHPTAPFHDPGRCRDRDNDGRCDSTCRPGDFVVEQPLGPSMDADPLRYDVWVEMDGRAVHDDSEAGWRVCLPGATAVTQIKSLYDPPPSAGRRRPPPGRGISVHWYNDQAFSVGPKANLPRLPSQAERRTWFDAMFTGARKYSGVFRYMVGTCGNKGQSDGNGRVGIVGVNDSPDAGLRVAHELGHLLGLSHYWDRPNPDRTPFYLSLMNYGYMYRTPPIIDDWDGTFVACGAGHPPCGEGFICVEALSAWRCVPDCGRRSDRQALRPPGFSTGALAFHETPRELDEIPETGYPRWFLPWLYCYTDERHRISHSERARRFVSTRCEGNRCVRCGAGSCDIDWDQDGSFRGAAQHDVDFSNSLDDAPLVDRDDFRRMVETARKGLARMSFRDVVVMVDSFEPGTRTDFVPGGLGAAPEPQGGLWADVTNVCDEAGRWTKCRNRSGNHAALFRGPASGDRGMRYGACDTDDGSCRRAYRSDSGATLSLRVKAWTPSWEGDGAVLAWLDGYRLEARVSRDGSEIRWRVLPPGSDGPLVELLDSGGVGQWTRLVLQINRRKGQVRLIAKRGDRTLDEHTRHRLGALDLSQLWIGASPGKVTSLTGLIDDVVLIAWPVKY